MVLCEMFSTTDTFEPFLDRFIACFYIHDDGAVVAEVFTHVMIVGVVAEAFTYARYGCRCYCRGLYARYGCRCC